MFVAETILGNVESDPELATAYENRPQSEIEHVVLNERERRRSRVRTTTDAGTDIGIVVDSDQTLSPGDVLHNTDDRMIIVTFEDRTALVISFEDDTFETDTLLELTQLGYRVGNRHWDLAVRGDEILIGLGADNERNVREVTDSLPSDVQTRRETVDPTRFDETPGHGGHSAGTGHGHGHGHGSAPGYRTISTGKEGEQE